MKAENSIPKNKDIELFRKQFHESMDNLSEKVKVYLNNNFEAYIADKKESISKKVDDLKWFPMTMPNSLQSLFSAWSTNCLCPHYIADPILIISIDFIIYPLILPKVSFILSDVFP